MQPRQRISVVVLVASLALLFCAATGWRAEQRRAEATNAYLKMEPASLQALRNSWSWPF